MGNSVGRVIWHWAHIEYTNLVSLESASVHNFATMFQHTCQVPPFPLLLSLELVILPKPQSVPIPPPFGMFLSNDWIQHWRVPPPQTKDNGSLSLPQLKYSKLDFQELDSESVRPVHWLGGYSRNSSTRRKNGGFGYVLQDTSRHWLLWAKLFH